MCLNCKDNSKNGKFLSFCENFLLKFKKRLFEKPLVKLIIYANHGLKSLFRPVRDKILVEKLTFSLSLCR